MKILAFCFFPAYVPPENGGQSRLFNFYRSLSRWHDITLLTSGPLMGEEERVCHGAGLVERRIPKDGHFAREYEALKACTGTDGDLSAPALAAASSYATPLHQAYLEEYESADLIIHEFPFTIGYDLLAGLDNKPRVYSSHNSELQLYKGLHPSSRSTPIHRLVEEAETAALKYADLVLYCGEGDLKDFQARVPDRALSALFVPHGMTLSGGLAVGRQEGSFSAVFMGSAHPPNNEAAEFIAAVLAPQLPEITFHLIGSCTARTPLPVNVQSHGVISEEDKRTLFGQANVALNPMASGSGANVKVLDYLAHGLPVIATSFGMRGVEAEAGRTFLHAELDEFADVLRAASQGQVSLEEIAHAGQVLAQERYTWDAVAAAASDALCSLLDSAQARSCSYVLALNDYDSFAMTGGGATRTRGLYEVVAGWSPVVFLCYSDSHRLQARRLDERLAVITVPRTREHDDEIAYFSGRNAVSVDDIVAGRQCLKNPYLVSLYRLLKEQARAIVLEHCYLADLPRYWGDRFVYSSQNHEKLLKERLLAQHVDRDSLLADVARWEAFCVEAAAAVIAVSAEDAATLGQGREMSAPLMVVGNGAAEPLYGETITERQVELGVQEAEARQRLAAVFLGSAHMPNIEAARYLVEKIAPLCPKVQFHLIGSVCESLPSARANVCYWGVLDEVSKAAVMQSCDVALNPVITGSGSNIKLADYIGNGLFVLSTPFGSRGYEKLTGEHMRLCKLEDFSDELNRLAVGSAPFRQSAREQRKTLFDAHFSMKVQSRRFVSLLQNLEKPRKRVLYVAYRYTSPPLGGAELNMEKFIRALGESGEFEVDVIAPEVSGIHNRWRFAEEYSWVDDIEAPVNVANVRFARFPMTPPEPSVTNDRLRAVWSAQPLFEQAVSRRLEPQYDISGLAWGWSYPEGEGSDARRWSFTACALHCVHRASARLEGYTPAPLIISAWQKGRLVAGPKRFQGRFEWTLPELQGEVMLESSVAQKEPDPRPLGFLLTKLSVGDAVVDIAAPLLSQKSLQNLPAQQAFALLDEAATASRGRANVALTDGRGPWSVPMERFIADHVGEYDLVVTHNNVFRPAVVAMAEAKRRNVPSILVPHAHFDDDFYHFPDVLRSAQAASRVLVVPRVAAEFLADKDCRAQYMPAGCDADETFGPDDIASFRKVCPVGEPFVLVLGRKAGAKGYRKVVEAVERIRTSGVALKAIVIGPDDDGLPLQGAAVEYLGPQPRAVVRGALQSCVALCNMSMSESFGIVLLEAWLAGKPVIANRHCAAFHDLAEHECNALLVDEYELQGAIERLLNDQALCERLAVSGIEVARQFDWALVSERFLEVCRELTGLAAADQTCSA